MCQEKKTPKVELLFCTRIFDQLRLRALDKSQLNKLAAQTYTERLIIILNIEIVKRITSTLHYRSKLQEGSVSRHYNDI